MTTNTPRRKRIVLCRGQYCNMGRRADKLYPQLEKLVDEINGDQYPKPVKLEIANCLSMCGAGPNLMIYPDGVACNGIEENMLEEIVDTYLRE
ncbi:MAG: (2Fe-2S) ferredoxin domain-containing protein [Chloroflexota bacterium]